MSASIRLESIEDPCAVDELCFNALHHDPFEEVPERLLPPSPSCLREDAVVGNGRLDREPEKPKPVQSLGEGIHEFSLRADIVEYEKEHELEKDRGRGGDIAVFSISLLHFLVDELEVDQFFDLP